MPGKPPEKNEANARAFNLKLATNQDLSAAEKTARDAEAQLTTLQRAGAGGDNRIRSDMAGVIAKVNVQDGQIVAAGSPLIEIVAESEIEVKLGLNRKIFQPRKTAHRSPSFR